MDGGGEPENRSLTRKIPKTSNAKDLMVYQPNMSYTVKGLTEESKWLHVNSK